MYSDALLVKVFSKSFLINDQKESSLKVKICFSFGFLNKDFISDII
jgi:hypothetical protein